MQPASPLRYPGGKACLSDLLHDVIDLNDLSGAAYFEPYAGGAGAALELLRLGVVSRIHINDADPRVWAFWMVAVNESERFCDSIMGTPLNMAEWVRQRDICANPQGFTRFEVGFSAFFMSRCNRSGVLTGAGPIGGYGQAGKWTLDVRFNREGLAERILLLRRLRDNIEISNEDALEFLKRALPKGRGRSRVFVYLDPPYVGKGQRLYLNSYEAKDHVELAKYMNRQNHLPWIMSYDDTELVRQLYGEQQLGGLAIRYSLQKKRNASELLIAPPHMSLPKAKLQSC